MDEIEFIIVSLPDAKERRANIEKTMASSPYKWRFFDALGPDDIQLPYNPEEALLRRGYKLSKGELGCFASHYACLNDHASGLNGTAEYILIMEDDVVIDPKFDFHALPAMTKKLDIHYLKLFSRYICRAKFLGALSENRRLFRFASPSFGTQAYLVSRKGAQAFVGAIKKIVRPIDDEMERFWVTGLPLYALYPYPVMEINHPTTITKGKYKFSPLTTKQKIFSFIFRAREKLHKETRNFIRFAHDRAMRKNLNASGLYTGP